MNDMYKAYHCWYQMLTKVTYQIKVMCTADRAVSSYS